MNRKRMDEAAGIIASDAAEDVFPGERNSIFPQLARTHEKLLRSTPLDDAVHQGAVISAASEPEVISNPED